METVKYYLSKTELDNLRLVCKYTKLSFHAMAARPEVAKQLIREQLAPAKLAMGAV